MFFYRAVVFLFLDSISFVLAENAYIGLEQLVTNLVTIDNTDLVLISDFTTESQVCFCNPLQIVIIEMLLKLESSIENVRIIEARAEPELQ